MSDSPKLNPLGQNQNIEIIVDPIDGQVTGKVEIAPGVQGAYTVDENGNRSIEFSYEQEIKDNIQININTINTQNDHSGRDTISSGVTVSYTPSITNTETITGDNAPASGSLSFDVWLGHTSDSNASLAIDSRLSYDSDQIHFDIDAKFQMGTTNGKIETDLGLFGIGGMEQQIVNNSAGDKDGTVFTDQRITSTGVFMPEFNGLLDQDPALLQQAREAKENYIESLEVASQNPFYAESAANDIAQAEAYDRSLSFQEVIVLTEAARVSTAQDDGEWSVSIISEGDHGVLNNDQTAGMDNSIWQYVNNETNTVIVINRADQTYTMINGETGKVDFNSYMAGGQLVDGVAHASYNIDPDQNIEIIASESGIQVITADAQINLSTEVVVKVDIDGRVDYQGFDLNGNRDSTIITPNQDVFNTIQNYQNENISNDNVEVQQTFTHHDTQNNTISTVSQHGASFLILDNNGNAAVNVVYQPDGTKLTFTQDGLVNTQQISHEQYLNEVNAILSQDDDISNDIYYTVNSGDTVSQIAQDLGLNDEQYRQFLDANGLVEEVNANGEVHIHIEPGQVLINPLGIGLVNGIGNDQAGELANNFLDSIEDPNLIDNMRAEYGPLWVSNSDDPMSENQAIIDSLTPISEDCEADFANFQMPENSGPLPDHQMQEFLDFISDQELTDEQRAAFIDQINSMTEEQRAEYFEQLQAERAERDHQEFVKEAGQAGIEAGGVFAGFINTNNDLNEAEALISTALFQTVGQNLLQDVAGSDTAWENFDTNFTSNINNTFFSNISSDISGSITEGLGWNEEWSTVANQLIDAGIDAHVFDTASFNFGNVASGAGIALLNQELFENANEEWQIVGSELLDQIASGSTSYFTTTDGFFSDGGFSVSGFAYSAGTSLLMDELGIGTTEEGAMLAEVGNIVGTIFGGPVGGAVGQFVGGVVGDLFGSEPPPPPPLPTGSVTFTFVDGQYEIQAMDFNSTMPTYVFYEFESSIANSLNTFLDATGGQLANGSSLQDITIEFDIDGFTYQGQTYSGEESNELVLQVVSNQISSWEIEGGDQWIKRALLNTAENDNAESIADFYINVHSGSGYSIYISNQAQFDEALADPDIQAQLTEIRANEATFADLEANYQSLDDQLPDLQSQVDDKQAELDAQIRLVQSTSDTFDLNMRRARQEVIEQELAELNAQLSGLQNDIEESKLAYEAFAERNNIDLENGTTELEEPIATYRMVDDALDVIEDKPYLLNEHENEQVSRLQNIMDEQGVDLSQYAITDFIIENINGDIIVAIRDDENPDLATTELTHIRIDDWLDHNQSITSLYLQDGTVLNLQALIEQYEINENTGAVKLEEAMQAVAESYGIENGVVGTASDDVLVATDDNPNLIGLEGDDTLIGDAGNNTLMGGEGFDELIGGEGIDTASYQDADSGVIVNLQSGQAIEGGRIELDENGESVFVRDSVDTLDSIENVIGSDYSDEIIGNDESNVLQGLKGDDHLDGGIGADVLVANQGNDQISGGEGDDKISGGRGNDHINAGEGDDLVFAGLGDDIVLGGAGDDILLGQTGDDQIQGGAGNDFIDGGSGNDIVYFEYDFENYQFDYQADSLLITNTVTNDVDKVRNVETLVFANGYLDAEKLIASLQQTNDDEEDDIVKGRFRANISASAPTQANIMAAAAAYGLLIGQNAQAIEQEIEANIFIESEASQDNNTDQSIIDYQNQDYDRAEFQDTTSLDANNSVATPIQTNNASPTQQTLLLNTKTENFEPLVSQSIEFTPEQLDALLGLSDEEDSQDESEFLVTEDQQVVEEIIVPASADLTLTAEAISGEDTTLSISLNVDLLNGQNLKDIYIFIEGVPEGATLTVGEQLESDVWIIEPEDLSALAINPIENSNVDFDITIRAVAVSSNGQTQATEITIPVTLESVADVPILDANVIDTIIPDVNADQNIQAGIENDLINAGGGNDIVNAGAGDDEIHGDGFDTSQSVTIDLNIQGQLLDTDGSETLFITVFGLPEDAILNVGSVLPVTPETPAGTWVIPADQLGDVNVTFPLHEYQLNQTLNYYVVANSADYDADNGNTDYAASEPQLFTAVIPEMLDGNDELYGEEGNDVIYGNGGNDILDGGIGADYLDGGIGNDELRFDGEDTDVIGGEGIDIATAETSATAITDKTTFDGVETIIGSNHDDKIIADNTGVTMEGREGNDTLKGGEGDDIINGGAGTDEVDAGGGDDIIYVDSEDMNTNGSQLAIDEFVFGGEGIDEVIMQDASDYSIDLEKAQIENVTANAGDDFILASDQINNIEGGAGEDTVSYENSAAAVNIDLNNVAQSSGDAEGDQLTNIENIVGSNFDDSLVGNAENNKFVLGNGNDVVDGGAGENVVVLAGDHRNFEITFGPNNEQFTDGSRQATITNISTGEIKTLTNINSVEFDNYTLHLDGTNNAPYQVNDNQVEVSFLEDESITLSHDHFTKNYADYDDDDFYVGSISNNNFVDRSVNNNNVVLTGKKDVNTESNGDNAGSAVDISYTVTDDGNTFSSLNTFSLNLVSINDVPVFDVDKLVDKNYLNMWMKKDGQGSSNKYYHHIEGYIYANDVESSTLAMDLYIDPLQYVQNDNQDQINFSTDKIDIYEGGKSGTNTGIVYSLTITDEDGAWSKMTMTTARDSTYNIDGTHLYIPKLIIEDSANNSYLREESIIDYGFGIASKVIEVTIYDSSTNQYSYTSQTLNNFPPIAFDLDGDGFEFIAIQDSGVWLDPDGDQILENIAWLSADDGFLAIDRNQDGVIDGSTEINFAQEHPDAHTDLEGLAIVYDSNGDGRLDATDDRWDELLIWQDQNQNGIGEAGEYMSLDAMGITSFSVISNQEKQFINDAHIFGTADVQWQDGSTSELADVALNYVEESYSLDFSFENNVVSQLLAQDNSLTQNELDLALLNSQDIDLNNIDWQALASQIDNFNNSSNLDPSHSYEMSEMAQAIASFTSSSQSQELNNTNNETALVDDLATLEASIN